MAEEQPSSAQTSANDMYDARYECDAPMHFDFSLADESDEADQWFDCDSEARFSDDFVRDVQESEQNPPSNVESQDEPPKPKNIVTSWSNQDESDAEKPKSDTERVPVRRSTRTRASDLPARVPSKSAMPQRIAAVSDSKSSKTTEEREMEKIASLRAKAKKVLQISQDSFKQLAKTKITSSDLVERKASELSVTQPKEFQFRVDERLRRSNGNHSMKLRSHREEIEHPDQFPAMLRNFNNSKSQKSKPLTPDQVKPFSFACDLRKRKHPGGETEESQPKRFVPMAAQIKKFHLSTPIRFRSHPKNKAPKGPVKSQAPLRVTLPRTPKLLTKTRQRAPLTSTTVQELNKMKNFHFKATEINHNIFDMKGSLGLPEKPVRQKIIIDEFSLETEKRAAAWQEKAVKDEETEIDGAESVPVFQAQPVPKNILEKIVGVPEKKEIPLTAPKTPNFKKVPPKVQRPEEEQFVFKPIPLPESQLAFKPTLKHESTKAQPFSFDGKYKDPEKVKEQLVEKETERLHKMSEFHAQPLPPSTHFVPSLNTRVTTMQPFALETEIRGKDAAKSFMKRVQEEVASMRAKREFKAQPCDVINQKPFTPQLPETLLPVDPFVLNTEKRSQERQILEMKKKQAEEEKKRIESEKEAIKEQEEKENLKRLRNSLVHHAKPVPKAKPFVIEPSHKEPTQPQTPDFLLDKRLVNGN